MIDIVRQIEATRSASAMRGGFRISALMTLKIAVFAPIPKPNVNTATSVNPGFFKSIRQP